MVPYGVFMLLFMFAILCWGIGTIYFQQEDASESLNRTGIVLEILGLVSVVPELIQETTLKKLEAKLRWLPTKGLQKYLEDYLSNEDYLETSLTIEGVIGFINLVSNILVALGFTISWLAMVLGYVRILYNWEITVTGWGIVLPCFVWIVLLAILWWFEKRREKVPALLGILFVIFHAFVSLLSLPLSAGLAFAFKLGLQVLMSAQKITLKRLIAYITLPLILFGSILQLVATYL